MAQIEHRVLRKPKYEPEKWKSLLGAGCYPYALDMETNKFLLIGDFIDKECTHKTPDVELVETLKEELRFLGYSVKEVETESKTSEGEFKIYLKRNNDGKYHFYRQDDDGFWSHKFPGALPIRCDSFGNVIADPDCMIEPAYTGWCFLLKR